VIGAGKKGFSALFPGAPRKQSPHGGRGAPTPRPGPGKMGPADQRSTTTNLGGGGILNFGPYRKTQRREGSGRAEWADKGGRAEGAPMGHATPVRGW